MMPSGLLFVLLITAAVLIWGVVTFNAFVASRNRYKNAFSQIDVQLKRRYDLIPNLVNATKAYLAHERGTLEAVISSRTAAMQVGQEARRAPDNAAALGALAAAEGALTGHLGRLLALAEAYPELKADHSVARLTEELRSTENRISFARQSFNDQVTIYNTGVQSFPATLVAQLTGFSRASELRATNSVQEREPVVVAL